MIFELVLCIEKEREERKRERKEREKREKGEREIERSGVVLGL